MQSVLELTFKRTKFRTADTLASCHELWTNGERNDDHYYIQPSLDGPPFEAFCIFNDKGATTVVEQYQTKNGRTATPNENDGCEERLFE